MQIKSIIWRKVSIGDGYIPLFQPYTLAELRKTGAYKVGQNHNLYEVDVDEEDQGKTTDELRKMDKYKPPRTN